MAWVLTLTLTAVDTTAFSNKVGLKCPSISPYVRTSTKRFFNFSEIWHVGKGRWVMHAGMQYDPIQGQFQGQFQALESWKSFYFQILSPAPFTMAGCNWPRILKLGHNMYIFWGRIFEFCPRFCVTWLWTWQKRHLWRVDRQSRTVLIYCLPKGLQVNLANTPWARRTAVTRLAVTPPKVNRFGWKLENCELNVEGWPWQILGTICSVATVWEGAEICFFCLSAK